MSRVTVDVHALRRGFMLPAEAERLGCAYLPIMCRGPHCVAWEWRHRDPSVVHATPHTATREPKRPAHVSEAWTWYPYGATEDGDPEVARWEEPEQEFRKRRRGYCLRLASEDARRDLALAVQELRQ